MLLRSAASSLAVARAGRGRSPSADILGAAVSAEGGLSHRHVSTADSPVTQRRRIA